MASYKSFKRIATDSFVTNSVTAADIAASAVTNGKLATDSVTQAKIANGAVGAAQLANAVDLSSKTVTYRPIVAGDISSSAAIAASKLAGGAATTNLGYTPLNNTNGTMTGNLIVPAGSTGAPGVALSGNTNTGIHFDGSNNLYFTTAGTQRMRIDPNGRRYVGTDSNNGSPMFQSSGSSGWTYSNSYGGPGWREIGGNFGWNSYQRGGSNFNNGNGRFTAPVSGFYHFQWQTYAHNDTNNTDGYFHMTFTRNGSTGAWSGRTPHGMYAHGTIASHPNGVFMDLDLYLNAGEFSSVMFYWNNNNTRIHGSHSVFNGYMIG